MELDFEPKEFFSDRLRLFALVAGFLLGLKLSFEAGSLFGVFFGAFSVGLLFTLLAVMIEDIRQGDLEAAGKVSGLILLMILGGTVFFLQDGMTCMSAVRSVDYNSLDDSCEVNTYTCDVDRSWYMSQCSGQNLENYCDRKNFDSVEDLSKVEKIKKLAGNRAGYQACKDAGLVE